MSYAESVTVHLVGPNGSETLSNDVRTISKFSSVWNFFIATDRGLKPLKVDGEIPTFFSKSSAEKWYNTGIVKTQEKEVDDDF